MLRADENDIYGCMDEVACNYNDEATKKKKCKYPKKGQECENSFGFEPCNKDSIKKKCTDFFKNWKTSQWGEKDLYGDVKTKETGSRKFEGHFNKSQKAGVPKDSIQYIVCGCKPKMNADRFKERNYWYQYKKKKD